jgi:hypothetical protein
MSTRPLTVLFTFIDEGQRSIAKFERFLSTHDKLLCSLPAFEVIYVAITPELFKDAQDLFVRFFPARPVRHLKKLPVIGGQTSPTIEGRIDRRACRGLLSISSRVGPGL